MNHVNQFYRSKLLSFGILLFAILFSAVVLAALPAYDSQGKQLPSLAPMLEQITDSVVNISTTAEVKRSNGLNYEFFNDPLFRHFFGDQLGRRPQQSEEKTNLGSGVIIDAKKGYVLTNNHVVADAKNIKVTLKDGRQFEAELVGSDEKTDIALLKIPSDDLTAIQMANSEHVRVGDFAVAIGNPFGIGQSVTSGIISALGRTNLGIEGYEDFIQTDASINPGNSGGALVNLNGKLIGINTAILSKSGGNVGIGFAIPVNMAKSIMQQLVKHGEVSRGMLGVHIQDLTPKLAEALGTNQKSGAIIAQVMNDSPAEKAGLENGDIVIKADDKAIDSASDLRNYIGLKRPDENVRLQIVRDNRNKTIVARISGEGVSLTSNDQFDGKKIHPKLAGAFFVEGKKGIEVAEIKRGSKAWQTGLVEGDRIVSINRLPVNNFSDLNKIAKRNMRRMAINIIRGNTALFLALN